MIRTPYIEKLGTDLPLLLKLLKENKYTKKYTVPLIHYLGMQALQEAAEKPTWKTVWSAGQSVGMVDEILSVRDIIGKLVREYESAVQNLPRLSSQGN